MIFLLCPLRPEKRGRTVERTEPLNGGIFTAAMLPPDFPAFDGSQNCATSDAEAFFPEPGTEAATVRELRKVCRHCAFIQPCATWALEHDETGFWGGTSERERRAIRRRQRVA